MSDFISRQTALDGLEYEMKYGAEIDRCGLDTAYDIIENIPSTEPERKWIPVTERLPEDGERVLTTIETESKGKQVRSGTYFKGYFNNDNGNTWHAKDKEVIAWMLLPEPWQNNNK